MTSEMKQQFTLRISQANATELVVLLYEMLLQYVEEAGEAIRQQDKQTFTESINRARGCLSELLQSVNPQYEIGRNLNQLYFFCIRRLANSRYHMEEKPLAEIEKVIRPLLGAYREVSARNPAGPVMENSQSVYVGLTYGRHTLTENMADQCPNRGMFA